MYKDDVTREVKNVAQVVVGMGSPLLHTNGVRCGSDREEAAGPQNGDKEGGIAESSLRQTVDNMYASVK